MRRNPICHTFRAILLFMGLLIMGVTAAAPATADHDSEPAQASVAPSLGRQWMRMGRLRAAAISN